MPAVSTRTVVHSTIKLKVAGHEVAFDPAKGLSNEILDEVEPNEPDKCFQPDALQTPSLHLRLAWADGRRWATFYPRESIPAPIAELVEACRRLGLKEIASLGGRTLTPEEALREVKSPPPS